MFRRVVCTVIVALSMAGVVWPQVCDLNRWSTVSTPGSLARPITINSIAYVAAGSAGIVRIAATNPRELALLGSDATDGAVHDLTLEYFRDLLVTAEDTAGIGTYTYASDGVEQVAVTDFGETIISVQGLTTEFLAGSLQGTLFTVTLDGDDAPVMQGSLSVGGEVVDLEHDGATAYCALGSGNAIAVVDLADRANPQLVTTHALGGAVTSLAIDRETLYAGVEGVGVVSLEIGVDGLVEVDTLELSAAPHDIYAWDKRVFIAGPDLGLVVADSSLGSGLLQIASDDLSGSEAIAVNNNVILASRGIQGFTSVNAGDCDPDALEVVTSYIPAAARSRGAEGTFWLTDVAIANLSGSPTSVNIAYLIKERKNSSPLNEWQDLGDGEHLMMNDIFDSLFGLDRANGALRVTLYKRDVKITSRTYNAEGAAGTYGQFIPALTRTAAVVPGLAGVLLQLQQNQSFRTNIGMINVTSLRTDVEIHLKDSQGVNYGVETYTLRPFEMYQFDRIFNSVDAGTVDSGYAMVKVLTEGGKVISYASVVDNDSGDPIYIPSQPVLDLAR
jgi:hypothetical protein